MSIPQSAYYVQINSPTLSPRFQIREAHYEPCEPVEPSEHVSPRRRTNIITPPHTPDRNPERMGVQHEVAFTPSTRNRLPVAHLDADSVRNSTSRYANDISPTILFPLFDEEETPTHTSMPLANPVAEPFQCDTCPICLEHLLHTDLFITRCGHQFHGTCMLNHITSRYTTDTCPTCREHLL
jgi:hypothetical protein